MRGRDLYGLSRPFLLSLVSMLRSLPCSFSSLLMLVVRYLPTKIGVGLRFVLLKRLTKECGDCVAVFEGVYLSNLSFARFGNHLSIHPMCYIDAAGGLIIGSDVSIAHGTTIMTTEHDFSTPWEKIRDAPVKKSAVRIGSDVWIGAGVKILAGVKIGDHVVVGAGAVVTKDIPSHSLAVGVPARVIKTIKSRTMRNGHDESYASF